MNVTIDVIDDPRTFAGMREEWNELLEASSADSLFLTWEWLHTWWENFSDQKKLFIVTVRRGSRLMALAPLTVRPRWFGPLLEFAGAGTIGSDYLDLIIRKDGDTEVVAALGRFLASNRVALRLPRVSESSGLAVTIAAALELRGWRFSRVPTEVCPFINLSQMSFDDYLASIGPSHRYNFKRRLRNLGRDHALDIRHVVTDDERADALNTVVDLHLRRWNGRGGSDAFNSPAVLRFHETFSRLALDRGWLRMMVVRLDGRAAAAFYGFRYGAKYLFYQSGFDPDFIRSSVGLVMIGLTIQQAIAEGAAEYDMLHGDEAYKFLWAKDVHQLVRLDVFPPGRRGRAHEHAVTFTAATRKFAKRFLFS